MHRPFWKLVHRPRKGNVAMGTTWALSDWAHTRIILESMLEIQACKVLSRKREIRNGYLGCIIAEYEEIGGTGRLLGLPDILAKHA